MNNPAIMISDDMKQLPQQNQTRSLVDIEQSRAMQEVQAMCVIAQRAPRDVTQCYTSVMKELQRYSLARASMYSFPRGNGTVSGPSIRMMEMIARNFKNLKYGTKIISLENGIAECESYCWDLESNIHKSIPFKIKLVRDTRQGPKPLTDERDIYELVANYGARRVRSCIQAMIPADIIEDAIKVVGETIKKGEGSLPFDQRVRNLVLALDKEHSVTQEMIEDKYEQGIDQINADQFVELFGIYNALKDKTAKREDYFDFKKPQTDTADLLRNEPKEKKS